jgi:hypothetical protein
MAEATDAAVANAERDLGFLRLEGEAFAKVLRNRSTMP